MEHPTCSPRITSGCFRKLSALKGQYFGILKTLKNVMTALKAIPQPDFHKCFQEWQHG